MYTSSSAPALNMRTCVPSAARSKPAANSNLLQQGSFEIHLSVPTMQRVWPVRAAKKLARAVSPAPFLRARNGAERESRTPPSLFSPVGKYACTYKFARKPRPDTTHTHTFSRIALWSRCVFVAPLTPAALTTLHVNYCSWVDYYYLHLRYP